MSDPTRIKADIIPYNPEYAQIVRSWIESEETYKSLCRGQDFPPPEDVVDSWQRPDVAAYLLSSERKPVAYGELWNRPLENAVEIAHLLVDPYKRSRGYGTKMLNLLYEAAARRPDIVKVILNLYGDSEEILGCFVKAGFEMAGTTVHTMGLRMVRLVERR